MIKNKSIAILLIVILICIFGCSCQSTKRFNPIVNNPDFTNIEKDFGDFDRAYFIKGYAGMIEAEDGSIWYFIYDTEKMEIRHKEKVFPKRR